MSWFWAHSEYSGNVCSTLITGVGLVIYKKNIGGENSGAGICLE